MFLAGRQSPHLILSDGAPASSNFFRPFNARKRMRSSNQILHGDHGERIIFYKVDQVPDLVKKNFVTRMLTRDLFAVLIRLVYIEYIEVMH